MATFPYTLRQSIAVTRIRTGVAAATTQSTNHYTITACHWLTKHNPIALTTLPRLQKLTNFCSVCVQHFCLTYLQPTQLI